MQSMRSIISLPHLTADPWPPSGPSAERVNDAFGIAAPCSNSHAQYYQQEGSKQKARQSAHTHLTPVRLNALEILHHAMLTS